MNQYKTILKIILPPLSCFLGLSFIYNKLNFYPLLFGMTIAIFNWGSHKFNPYLGTALTVLFSYISYGIGLLSLGIFVPMRNFLINNTNLEISKEEIGKLGYIISPFVIAPLILFFTYKIVFNIPKTKLTKVIITTSIIVLILQSYFFFKQIALMSTDMSDYKFLNPYTIWQFIMAFALQLLIYQKELGVNKEK